MRCRAAILITPLRITRINADRLHFPGVAGPYGQIGDSDGLRTLAERSAMLGFDRKWALNPVQVDVINQALTPRQQDFDKAMAIVEAYRQATDNGTGVVILGGEMIDEASGKVAVVMVERGEAFGMNARPWPASRSS